MNDYVDVCYDRRSIGFTHLEVHINGRHALLRVQCIRNGSHACGEPYDICEKFGKSQTLHDEFAILSNKGCVSVADFDQVKVSLTA